ncbi:hypothetical protein U8527_04705 [Kordia algicida OT-1]|uniref:Lipoprotein n=1 Tax=Kordia algicida OT-1 TaxID=391587 RepID=A9DM40_9FLAO|nr:hypothetical protein [Kordia algicida]EDP97624.1 hypothetical protein KAOT1_20717 [Kordia algicida OT-1]
MKKIYLGLLVAFVTLFTSCKFTENIYINDDGTGKVSFTMDGSELMDMMGEEMAKEDEKVIDSTISFKELFKEKRDSISKLSAEEQEKLKRLEAFTMRMLMNPKEKKMEMDLYADFESVNELQDMFAAMNTAGSMDKNKKSSAGGGVNPMSSLNSDGVTTTNYSFKNNVFSRNVAILDQTKLDSVYQNLGQAKMMFAASSYTLKYHFPKKIKSVSLENAVISEDGKSFTAELNFMEYLQNPETLNVEVKLEK